MPRAFRIAVLAAQIILAACFHLPRPDTPLTIAVAGGHTEIVRLLLERAPDLSLKVSDNIEGMISVWIARLRGRAEILRMIEEARRGA